MASIVWKGSLQFGPGELSVPVALVAAARSNKMSFSSQNPATGSGVKQQYIDASTKQVVDRSNLVKATVFKGQTVTVTDQELAGLVGEKDKVIDVLEFVKLQHVDPIHFDTSYFALPQDVAADYPYQLLVDALTSTKLCAIGRMVRANREHLVLVRPSSIGNGLVLHTLFHHNEVRSGDAYNEGGLKFLEEERKLMRRLLRAQSSNFNPVKYEDRVAERLTILLESKLKPVGEDLRKSLKESLMMAKAKAKKKVAK